MKIPNIDISNYPVKKILAYGVGGIVGLYILVQLILCLIWSRPPRVFDPSVIQEQTGRSVKDTTMVVPAFIHVMETLVNKPGGYMSNDRFPPGILLDNVPNWEWGVLQEARSFTQALRQDLSRAQAQSPERPELVKADAHFSFSHDAWIMPSSENEYRAGIRQLKLYMQALMGETENPANFTLRMDAPSEYLRRMELRLGALSARLRSSAGQNRYDVRATMSSEEREIGDNPPPVPRFKVDDTFFEARGSSWAMYHILKGLKIDYLPLLDQQRAIGAINRALSHLYAAQRPIRSPIILNGSEFGMIPNHSLTMAAHLAKSQLAIRDLRSILLGNPANN